MPNTPIQQVVIAGGGLAGLSAGCALAGAGYKVTLLERRPYVGGRASSYEHPGTGEIVDNCQHVLLGCCTNLIDLYERTGVEQKIRWFDRLTFIEPGGRRTELKPGLLPAPFHASGSFLRGPMLSVNDKVQIARAMLSFMPGIPGESTEKFLEWLKRHGQSDRAIRHFWQPVLVSALNEHLENLSTRYAIQVFRESFLKSADAGRMGVPTVPLTDLYASCVAYIESRQGRVHLRTPVESLRDADGQIEVVAGGQVFAADAVILAVPYGSLEKMLPALPEEPATEVAALKQNLEQFHGSPITGIHLWFDRQITELEHAVLLDRTIQWFFHKSLLREQKPHGARAQNEPEGSYVELVVSASTELADQSRKDIIDLAGKELAEFFPEAGRAKLLKATVIKEIQATYSARPGSDEYRPGNFSPWRNVFVAGDWTRTGWPATMEGAVRSGYQAAEALCGVSGKSQTFQIADLPAKGLMRLFEKPQVRPVQQPPYAWGLTMRQPADALGHLIKRNF